MAIVSSIKQGAARYAASALIAAGLIAGGAAAVAANPADAFASPEVGFIGSHAFTNVYLHADPNKLTVSAPTQINMIVQADGTLTGPSAAATQLQNGSVFGVHVKNIKATAENSFAFEETAAKSDSVSMNITPANGTAVNLASCLNGGKDVADSDWNLTKKGTDGATIDFTTGGTLSNVTKDLSTNQQFGTINWTFAAGNL